MRTASLPGYNAWNPQMTDIGAVWELTAVGDEYDLVMPFATIEEDSLEAYVDFGNSSVENTFQSLADAKAWCESQLSSRTSSKDVSMKRKADAWDEKYNVALDAAYKYLGKAGINSSQYSYDELEQFAISLAEKLAKGEKVNGMQLEPLSWGGWFVSFDEHLSSKKENMKITEAELRFIQARRKKTSQTVDDLLDNYGITKADAVAWGSLSEDSSTDVTPHAYNYEKLVADFEQIANDKWRNSLTSSRRKTAATWSPGNPTGMYLNGGEETLSGSKDGRDYVAVIGNPQPFGHSEPAKNFVAAVFIKTEYGLSNMFEEKAPDAETAKQKCLNYMATNGVVTSRRKTATKPSAVEVGDSLEGRTVVDIEDKGEGVILTFDDGNYSYFTDDKELLLDNKTSRRKSVRTKRSSIFNPQGSGWDELSPGDAIRVGFEEYAQDGTFVRLEGNSDPEFYGDHVVVVYLDENGTEKKYMPTGGEKPRIRSSKTNRNTKQERDSMKITESERRFIAARRRAKAKAATRRTAGAGTWDSEPTGGGTNHYYEIPGSPDAGGLVFEDTVYREFYIHGAYGAQGQDLSFDEYKNYSSLEEAKAAVEALVG